MGASMPTHDEEVRNTISACFADLRRRGLRVANQDLPECAAARELGDLEESVLRELPTLVWVVDKYKVPIIQLLEILARYRLTWRFANSWPLFANWSIKKVNSMPKKLEEAARFLEDAGAYVSVLATLALLDDLEASLDEREPFNVVQQEEEQFAFRRDGGFSPPTTLNRADEARDTLILDRVVKFPWASQLLTAVNLLRLVASAVSSGVNWQEVRNTYGKRIFNRGRRRAQALEAAAAHDLVAFFQAQAGRPLYDYVGVLLSATFPTLRGWQGGGEKRIRDNVKQLLKQYPRPKVGKRKRAAVGG